MIIKANVDNTLPSINFDEVEGKIEIKGRSITGSPEEFYVDLINHIDVYTNHPSDLELTINLEYFNTPSARCLLLLFKSCMKVKENGAELKINWIIDIDDEDMIEIGEDYEDIIKHPFNFVYTKAD